ncbi:transporter, partial [Salmonella enterica subsp. enterica serovar Typhimurium]
FWAGGSMQDYTLPFFNSYATTTPLSTRFPFTKYDFGWGLLRFGMAIGAGTVLMPVRFGLYGICVVFTAFIFAYPATYIVQDIFLKTLADSESCDDYTDI